MRRSFQSADWCVLRRFHFAAARRCITSVGAGSRGSIIPPSAPQAFDVQITQQLDNTPESACIDTESRNAARAPQNGHGSSTCHGSGLANGIRHFPVFTQRRTTRSHPDINATPLAIPTNAARCLHPHEHRRRLVLGAGALYRLCLVESPCLPQSLTQAPSVPRRAPQ